jgi:Nucleotidyl transferase AbiEii toxin, Type IV TA system
MIRRYATPLAFKQALEQRIKSSSTTGADFARRRQLLVFDRFLARVVSVVGDAVTLKGGLVLEMRLARARTTKDIDLRMMGSADNVLERLQAAGRLDLGDYMFFEVQPDVDHPEIRNEGMQYDGYRYRAECRLAGALYSRPFVESTWLLGIRSSVSPILRWPTTFSASRALRLRCCACIRSSPTPPRSCMPSPSREAGPTLG